MKRRFLLLSTNLAREWLQTDTDLLLIITSTADELSGVPISMTLNDLDPQKSGFKVLFLLFRLRRTLRVHFRLNILDIDQDNLRTKLN